MVRRRRDPNLLTPLQRKVAIDKATAQAAALFEDLPAVEGSTEWLRDRMNEAFAIAPAMPAERELLTQCLILGFMVAADYAERNPPTPETAQ